MNNILVLHNIQSRIRYQISERNYMHHMRNRMPNHQFSLICNQLTGLSVKFCQNEISFSRIYLSFSIVSSDDIILVIQSCRTRFVNFSVSVIRYQSIIIKISLIKNLYFDMTSIIRKQFFDQLRPVKKVVRCALNCISSVFWNDLIDKDFQIVVIDLLFCPYR